MNLFIFSLFYHNYKIPKYLNRGEFDSREKKLADRKYIIGRGVKHQFQMKHGEYVNNDPTMCKYEFDKNVSQRNIDWVYDRILGEDSSKGTTFYCFGMNHLKGKLGVLRILADNKIIMTPMFCKEDVMSKSH